MHLAQAIRHWLGARAPASSVTAAAPVPLSEPQWINCATAGVPEILATELAEAGNLLRRRMPNDAMTRLDAVKQRRVPTPNLDYLRALCFLQQERPGDAIEALKEELRYFPNETEVAALLQRLLARMPAPRLPDDEEFRELYQAVRHYTMLGPGRLYSLFTLVRRICERDLPGNVVECGVAAGGASALMAAVMQRYSARPRRLFACDSFEGLPAPGSVDLHYQGQSPAALGWGGGTCAAPVDSLLEVCRTLHVEDVVEPVRGFFAETLPVFRNREGAIALLHVDGDWYESTRTVFQNLYELVVDGGCIQIDDYAYWQGCRRAVEDFQKESGLRFELHLVEDIAAWMEKTGACRVIPR